MCWVWRLVFGVFGLLVRVCCCVVLFVVCRLICVCVFVVRCVFGALSIISCRGAPVLSFLFVACDCCLVFGVWSLVFVAWCPVFGCCCLLGVVSCWCLCLCPLFL